MLLFAGIILFLFLVMQPLQVLQFHKYIAILFPKGMIGVEERNLLFILQILMLIVIIPVYVLTFVFSWIYRADNKKAKYDPELSDHWVAECVWWGIPILMTTFAVIIVWGKTHELDPYKQIPPTAKTLTIQVVALQWKWLFIYPEEKIASLNFVQIPKDIPIQFKITADAPMNSLWIPYLGGQIYAMPAMQTQLNLIANELGDFRGSSANLSGEGFASMHFITRASTIEDYQKWVESVKNDGKPLTFETYTNLAKPGVSSIELYQLEDENLFHQIMMKYMAYANLFGG